MDIDQNLTIRNLSAGYGPVTVLQDVDLQVLGKPLALIGRNGMGKSTLCKAIMGMLPASHGEVTYQGRHLTGLSSDRVARAGIGYVPQGRRLFPSLSVEEHLRLAARGCGARWTVERIFELFPRLAERRHNGGAELSGGEAQMVAIGRALMTCPGFIVLDEPTEGLAPVIVDRVIDVLRALAAEGIGILLVEQNITVATEVAQDVAVMVNGRIVAVEAAATLGADAEMQRRYLGVGSAVG